MGKLQIIKGQQFISTCPDWGYPPSENPLFRTKIGKLFDSNWSELRTGLATYLNSEMNLEIPTDLRDQPSLELFFQEISLKQLLNAISLTESYLRAIDDDNNEKLKNFELQKKNQAKKWNSGVKNIVIDLEQSITNNPVFGKQVGKFFDSNWSDSRPGCAEFLKSENGVRVTT